MADIIDFTAKRKQKAEPAPKPAVTSIQDVAFDAVDFLLGDWEKFAKKNRLNDYFKQYFPNFIDADSKVNYMRDLTELATLEGKIGPPIMVFFPGTIEPVQIGWVVRFKIADHEVSTPDMASECYARCFALLLYLKIKADAINLGLIE